MLVQRLPTACQILEVIFYEGIFWFLYGTKISMKDKDFQRIFLSSGEDGDECSVGTLPINIYTASCPIRIIVHPVHGVCMLYNWHYYKWPSGREVASFVLTTRPRVHENEWNHNEWKKYREALKFPMEFAIGKYDASAVHSGIVSTDTHVIATHKQTPSLLKILFGPERSERYLQEGKYDYMLYERCTGKVTMMMSPIDDIENIVADEIGERFCLYGNNKALIVDLAD